MKNQGNMASQKNCLFLAAKLRGTEYYKLSDTVENRCYEKLNRLQENSRQFNKIMNKICE